MKEVINLPGPTVKIVDSQVPEPNDDQILIKVVVSGSNPKDWKAPELEALGVTSNELLVKMRHGMNQGDDIAGIVGKVGSNVIEFKPGDRVAAFHEMGTPGGSYAEYAISWSHTTSHLPENTSFEEAATIPLAALTAAISLYAHHRLPAPWTPALKSIPLIVYGASTAVGSYAIKLACNSNIHPIIAIAGKGSYYVEGLIDRSEGDMIVDYRGGVEATVKGIRDGLTSAGHSTVRNAIDAAINIQIHKAPGYDDDRDLGLVFSRYFTKALQNKSFSGHPCDIRPGGLEGVEEALKDLKDGKASAVKYIFRIADTPGIVYNR
ncbi:hypothetical protein SI65_08595 [Aspergillus cristatus]|uniref:Enoyl reductase (ER) domain-containing protein n=1 Tax=Aspergillus cristatus TaxID=573508 RepID=A0A1E3B5T4_ASPCR|nr:hypothetical protein SI65_08595 [Aspergillus cristatus]